MLGICRSIVRLPIPSTPDSSFIVLYMRDLMFLALLIEVDMGE